MLLIQKLQISNSRIKPRVSHQKPFSRPLRVLAKASLKMVRVPYHPAKRTDKKGRGEQPTEQILRQKCGWLAIRTRWRGPALNCYQKHGTSFS